jgi:hypothetical protein
LWSALLRIAPGTAPMLVLQLGLYWLGLGLLAAACALRGHRAAGWAILGAGAATLLTCWMGAILKDGQMAGALAAAAGIAGWFRLGERRLPWWAAALVLLLLAYATLVRANAVFATVPLGLALFGWMGMRSPAARAALAVAAAAAIVLVAPPAEHELFRAEPSGVENSLLVFDIAGVAMRTESDIAGVPRARWSRAAARGCYDPAQWDMLGEPKCLVDPRFVAEPDARPVYRAWLGTILGHPIAYGLHRLAHFNATMRLFVPRNLPNAVSPVDSEPNDLGLGVEPGDVERALWSAGDAWSALPTAWPALWLALALTAMWPAAEAPPGPARDLAVALILSAGCGGLSYAIVSVASDLRYHLWTMLAAPAGIFLLAASGAIRRRHAAALVAVAVAVTLIGLAGRLLLPPLPPPV